MTRPLRGDFEGGAFHVYNRGRHKRPIFLEARDFERFLVLVACAVRRCEIWVYAFVLLSNHFHMVVVSRGRLSEAFRRIGNDYAHYHNRKYGDEGMLCRSRFGSKLIESTHYLCNAILYCDENPLDTDPPLAERPEDYEWGSAYRFARSNPPPWLSPRGHRRVGVSYGAAPQWPTTPEEREVRRWFIDTRMRHGEAVSDPLDLLLEGDRARVLGWLLQRSAPGEGGTCLPVAGGEIVQRAILALSRDAAELPVDVGGKKRFPASLLLTVGLLRSLTGLSFPTIAESCDRSTSTVQRLFARHGRALQAVPAYGELACRVVEACVAPLRVRKW